MILVEESSLALPKDPATVALIVTALVWLVREMFDIFVKPKLRKLVASSRPKTEEATSVEHRLVEKLEEMTRLEQRLQDLFASSMETLKDLQSTTRELQRDHIALDRAVAVGLNRIDHLEVDVDSLRKTTHDFRSNLQTLLAKHVKRP